MDLLNPNTGTIFWTVLTFILLLLMLKKFAWKPILDALDERENKIKSAIYQAEQDRKQAEKYLQEQKALIEKAKKESAQIIADSRDAAENMKKEIVDQAREEAGRLIEQARQEIDLSKETAISEIKKYAVDLSILAAQKVVGETLDTHRQKSLIEQYINELS
ncbi:ATP synthase F0 subunit B [candidate division KSB1 bacterium 4484_87]|nr:MAG: ATP synthase F0 subunit B [candidate division KSB1 bacterium 4484_87]